MAAQVSILIPAYNAASFIAKAIESVLAQTFTNWQLIVVDDFSSDNTYEIASQYASDKIVVHRNDSNLGMLGNWNRGILLCHSEYFVKLDADDYWHPEFLDASMKVIEANPDVGLVFTRYVNVDQDGKLVEGSDHELPEFARNNSFSCIPLVKKGVEGMLQYPILRQGLSVMRREIFDEIGAYKYLLTKETQSSTDTEFYFRLGCHYKIYVIDRVLYFYRVHPASVSSIDRMNSLQERKMYEIKHVINNYYLSQRKISTFEWIRNYRKTEFKYKRFLIYQYRREKRYAKFVANFLKTFFVYPVETMIFYSNRIFNRS